MKYEHKRMVRACLNVLHEIGINSDDIMLVGSITFDVMGIFPTNKSFAHDVDVIVRVNDEMKKKIQQLTKITNVMTSGEYIPNQTYSTDYIRNIKYMTGHTVDLNIWTVPEGTEFKTDIKLNDELDNIWVATLADTIKAKKQYNRAKDLVDINDIVKQLI